MNKSLLMKLAHMLIKLGSVKTDKGELNYDEDELKEGVEVLVANEEGDYVPAADGDYTDEEGNLIVVEGGVVKEIKPAVEEEVKEDEEEVKEEETEEKEEVEEEQPIEEQPIEEQPADNPELEEANRIIEEQAAKIAELEAHIAELEAELDKPVDEPLEMKAVAQDSKSTKQGALRYFNN